MKQLVSRLLSRRRSPLEGGESSSTRRRRGPPRELRIGTVTRSRGGTLQGRWRGSYSWQAGVNRRQNEQTDKNTRQLTTTGGLLRWVSVEEEMYRFPLDKLWFAEACGVACAGGRLQEEEEATLSSQNRGRRASPEPPMDMADVTGRPAASVRAPARARLVSHVGVAGANKQNKAQSPTRTDSPPATLDVAPLHYINSRALDCITPVGLAWASSFR